MINNIKSMQSFADAVKYTFKQYIARADSLWQDYEFDIGAGDPYYDPSMHNKEESVAIEERLQKGRAALKEQCAKAFPMQGYYKFALTFLDMLDHEMESLHNWFLYLDYQPSSDAEAVDMYGTVGAHSFIFTIIIDALSDDDKEIQKSQLLAKYKTALDENAKSMRKHESDVEILADTVCFINVVSPQDPRIGFTDDLIVHK